MSQKCQLCKGSGASRFNTYARCDRCDGKLELPDDFDQDAVRLTACVCGRCGGVHMFDAERQYLPACDEAPACPDV